MTRIFYVRHSECDHSFKDTVNRPLTEKGLQNVELVSRFLNGKKIDYIFSSPYKRAIDTIKPFAESNLFEIKIVEDFRERAVGESDDDFLTFVKKQWSDFRYKNYKGESLSEVQDRNIRAINKILNIHPNHNLVIAGHGTALSTIINYYDKSFKHENFLELLPKTPFIVEFIFENKKFVEKHEYNILTSSQELQKEV